MNCVSLVCTVHGETGRANASELVAILERIQPEVIFLEVPPEAFSDYYQICSKENLESKAVRIYRAKHQVELVPVDLPTPGREFFESHEQLNNTARDKSPRYRQLIQSEIYHVDVLGFAYLNGEDYCKLRSEIDREISSTIRELGVTSLIEFGESWSKMLVRRENAMMKNIRRYCRVNDFSRGVFLVGAAHRQAIIEKTSEQTASGLTEIRWDFDNWKNVG